MLKLNIIVASTRPGRVGSAIGKWFSEAARSDGRFESELIELADVGLPLLDEPAHPRLKQYQHAHTKNWSAQVEAADAFVFVTPEYNYSPPPSLINALDYLYSEWNYKPVGFVSYGGLSGGTRSVQIAKQIVTTLKMVPLVEAVAIPFFPKHMDDTGVFKSDEVHEKSATEMLAELLRWAEALRPMRTPQA